MHSEPIAPDSQKTKPEILDATTVSEQPSHLGLIVGIVIIVLTFIFIGLYVWNQINTLPMNTPGPNIERPTAAENNEPESTTAEARTEVLNIMSTSDQLSAIEADLEATKLVDIATELQAIDNELAQ